MPRNYISAVRIELAAYLTDCDADLLDLYTLLAVTRGADTTLKDVHDAWAVWRSRTNPSHKSLVPFEELTPEVQELDRKYMNAIHQAWLVSVA